jgi:Amidase
MTKSSARDRLEQALARIADPAGEGCRACLTVYTHAARAAADAADARAKLGISLGPLDGAIVSVKDLFGVAGEVTRAGSSSHRRPTDQETVARRLRLRPIASVDILHVCESNGSILFTSVVEVEGASCQEDKPTIEILGDG